MKALKKQVSSETDSEENLTSDDEFEVSQGVVYTLYNNKYIPIKYIGRGTFSRVWLTYDITNNRLVGMKTIFKIYDEEAQDEIKRCMLINEVGPYIRLSTLYDHFIHNTGETCLIFEILGVSMMSIMEHFANRIPLTAIKRVIKDMVTGLDTLHGLRLIHTDLKPENILTNIYTRGYCFYKDIFENNKFNTLYESHLTELLPERYESFTPTKKKKTKRTIKMKAGKQLCEHINTVVSECIKLASEAFDATNNQVTDLDNQVTNLDKDDSNILGNYFTFNDYQKQITMSNEEIINTIRVKIIDFGNCEEFDNKIQDEISIRCYRPPENFMNDFFNEKADIWATGCLLFEFLTGDYLFDIDSDCDQNERDRRYLYEISQILGQIPRKLCLNCDFSKDLFDKQGRILKMNSAEYTSISELLVDEYNYQEKDALEFESIIKLFLEYKVGDRISAKAASELEWLN
jgi:serine/threonine-protein kinase SRPK3